LPKNVYIEFAVASGIPQAEKQQVDIQIKFFLKLKASLGHCSGRVEFNGKIPEIM